MSDQFEADIKIARGLVKQIENDPSQAWLAPLARAFVRLLEEHEKKAKAE